jgi:hypothetical protein
MMDAYGSAISRIESGGKYDILGPVIPKSGDRAYGKYQVMGANVPQWTEQYLGRRMTPQEFLADPQAQDAVFKGRFGEYVQKYGPEGAAKAWFAGEKGMNNPNAKDVLGTTVQGYGQKFMAGLDAIPPGSPPLAPPISPPVNGGMPSTQPAPMGGPQGLLTQPPQAVPQGLAPQPAPAAQQGLLGSGMSPEQMQAFMAPPKPLQHLEIPMTRPKKAGFSLRG